MPALMLAAVVPLAVLATITAADWLSGVTIAVTLPLVPLFGAFIGMATSRHAKERWRALATLAHHFHDVVSGLPTLRVFGRADAQRTRIERVTAEYRRATMATLRLAFASSLALELIATMSVALVATEIGLRLAYGDLDLRTGLLVLILAPEAYLPLRALGTQFHATADGLEAAEKVFEILETPRWAPPPGARTRRRHRRRESTAGGYPIRIEGVSVWHEGRADPAPSGATFTIDPGRLTVLTGPSGCGKTTLLSCLLGFTEPTTGSITPRLAPGRGPRGRSRGPPPGLSWTLRTGAAFHPVPAPWHRHAGRAMSGSRTASFPSSRPALAAGWLPQDPTLFAGTVAENIRLGWPGAPDAAVAAAARAAALDDVDPRPGPRRTGHGPVSRAAPPCRPGPRAAAGGTRAPARRADRGPGRGTRGDGGRRAPPLRRRGTRGRGGKPPPGAHRRRRRDSRLGCPGRLWRANRNRGANGSPGMTANGITARSAERRRLHHGPRWTGPGRCHENNGS